jgi:hypothetical protein
MSTISPATISSVLPTQAAPVTPKQDSDGDHDNSPKSEVSDTTASSRTLNVVA